MKLWTIFRFEFAYQAGRLSTRLYLGVLLAFTFVMDLLITPGDGVYPNNTFHLTAITVIGALLWLVMSASVAGEAAARDVQTRMHPLTYTSPISILHYLGGRFLAAFAINALLVLSLPVGVLLFFYFPGLNEEEFLPLRLWPYLSVYFFIALPNAFIATALQFTVSVLSQKAMSSYLASLFLTLVAQILAVAAAKLFENWDLLKLLDPVGLSGIIGNEMQTWTPSDKNTRLVRLEGMFLLNRTLWLLLAIGFLVLTWYRFRFGNPETKSWWPGFKRRKKLQSQISATTAIIRANTIQVPQVPRKFGFGTWFRQTLTIAGASFGKIAKHSIGLTLVAVAVLASLVFASRILTQFGIPLLPTTQQVLGYLAAPVSNLSTPWVIIPLLIMYFSGELIWAERDMGLSDIADATPVPAWVLFMGKFLGLTFIVVVWMALLLAGGIGMQLTLGYAKFEIGLYLQTLFGLQLLDYLLFALLALVMHVVANQKYIGYLLVVLVFSFMAFPSTFQVEHNLLIFGAAPAWSYTEMRGFGNSLEPWFWFKAYWLGWALLLAVVATLFWSRGREQGFKYRLKLVQRRFTGATTWLAVIASGLIITLGSFIFYNTNVRNTYLTGSDLNAKKAAYEHRYSRYRNTLQPQLTGTKLHVELYPNQQQVDIQAGYTLVNNHAVAIDSIHLGSFAGILPENVTFSRAAESVVKDQEVSHAIYKLKQALKPGDSLQINFEIHYKQRGFGNNGTKQLVVENGTNFTNFDLLPSVGYQRFRELSGAVLRKQYNLSGGPTIPSLYDQNALKKPGSTDQISFEAIIGTTKNEVAVAPGKLKRVWTKGNRSYFHFKTDAQIGGEYAILSAAYAVQVTKWKDVAIRVYYHPDHGQNIDQMLRSVKASLAYYAEQFGPYPFKHFTVVERAGAGGGATADASIIYYGEQYALLNPDDSPEGFDLPYYILAHEVAHQWWGLARLTPAYVEGTGVLIEGLAVYSGMQVLEKSYGQKHLQQYVNYLHAFYEMPRSLATASLLQANEEFLYYRKGGLALYTLSKYLGKEKVNGALHQLLRKQTSGELPLPTTLHLYQELKNVTPDSLNYLLSDLFTKNMYWRLKTRQLVLGKTKTGDWEVTLKVQAQKVVVASTGAEKEAPMNDLLEIGLYEEGKSLNEPLYLQMHRIRSGEQIIKVTVPRKPERGGIDPNSLMIDVRLDENMMQVDGCVNLQHKVD